MEHARLPSEVMYLFQRAVQADDHYAVQVDECMHAEHCKCNYLSPRLAASEARNPSRALGSSADCRTIDPSTFNPCTSPFTLHPFTLHPYTASPRPR